MRTLQLFTFVGIASAAAVAPYDPYRDHTTSRDDAPPPDPRIDYPPPYDADFKQPSENHRYPDPAPYKYVCATDTVTVVLTEAPSTTTVFVEVEPARTSEHKEFKPRPTGEKSLPHSNKRPHHPPPPPEKHEPELGDTLVAADERGAPNDVIALISAVLRKRGPDGVRTTLLSYDDSAVQWYRATFALLASELIDPTSWFRSSNAPGPGFAVASLRDFNDGIVPSTAPVRIDAAIGQAQRGIEEDGFNVAASVLLNAIPSSRAQETYHVYMKMAALWYNLVVHANLLPSVALRTLVHVSRQAVWDDTERERYSKPRSNDAVFSRDFRILVREIAPLLQELTIAQGFLPRNALGKKFPYEGIA